MTRSTFTPKMNTNQVDIDRDPRVTAEGMFDATGSFHALWNNIHLTITIALTSYMTLVGLLRYRRMAKIKAPFTPGKRQLSSMTVKEAHGIMAQLQELEFPYAFAKARQIALLKVRTLSSTVEFN